MDLALNNLQRLICHKTQPTKRKTAKRTEYGLHETNGENISRKVLST